MFLPGDPQTAEPGGYRHSPRGGKEPDTAERPMLDAVHTEAHVYTRSEIALLAHNPYYSQRVWEAACCFTFLCVTSLRKSTLRLWDLHRTYSHDNKSSFRAFHFRACMQSHFSRVQLFATLWTIAHQAPLSMGFPSKNSGVSCWSFSRGSSRPRDRTQHLLHPLRWQAGSLQLAPSGTLMLSSSP